PKPLKIQASHCAPQNGSLNRHDCFRVIFHNPVNDILNSACVKALCACSLFTHFPCLLHDNKPIPDTIVPSTGLLQISFPDVMLPGGATGAKKALCCGL